MAVAAYVGILVNVNFDGTAGSRALLSSLHIKCNALVTELWPKMWVSILRSPPSLTLLAMGSYSWSYSQVFIFL